MTHRTRWIVALVSLALLAALGSGVVATAYEWGAFALVEPDRERWPLRGIDVSHHQGEIDWQAVARSEVDFAWIKSTEGGDWTDARFAENWEGAKQAGIPRGAYHFVTLCRPLPEQVRHIVATVPSDGELPLALDLEFGGNCAGRPDPAAFRAGLSAMRAALTEHCGAEPILYTTSDFERAYLLGYAPEAPRWRRDLLAEPEGLVWQLRNRGRVRGIDGPVDINVARGRLLP